MIKHKKLQRDTDSEFNSIHFGIKIKNKKFFETQKIFGSEKF
jgi:hypothetical protein